MLSLKQIKNLENESLFTAYKKIKLDLSNLKHSKIKTNSLISLLSLLIFIPMYQIVLIAKHPDINFLLLYLFIIIVIGLSSYGFAALFSEFISKRINKFQNLSFITKYYYKMSHKLYNYKEVDKIKNSLEEVSEEVKILLVTPFDINNGACMIKNLKRFLLVKKIEQSTMKEFDEMKDEILSISEILDEDNKIALYKAIEEKIILKNNENNQGSIGILKNIKKIDNTKIKTQPNTLIKQI
jgi:hypothetical protein